MLQGSLASAAFLACGLLSLTVALVAAAANECQVVKQVKCGEDGCKCSRWPEDKYCERTSIIECVNGQCAGGRCDCNPCWTGDRCDAYVNKASPTFAAAYEELEVLAAAASGERRVTFSTAADADAVECYKTSGRVPSCPCAEIKYEIVEEEIEGAVSIKNPSKPELIIRSNGSDQSAGSRPLTAFRVVVAALNAGAASPAQAQHATVMLYIKEVDKLSKVLPDAYAGVNSLDGTKRHPVKRDTASIDGATSAEEQTVLSRQRRGVAGAGIPDLMTFTLTRTTPIATNTFKIGDLLSYQLSIWVPKTATDCLVEVYAQRGWSTMFSISNLKVQLWGTNMAATPALNSTTGMYESMANDGRYDRGYIDLGTINNVGTDTTNPNNSQIILTFNALVLNHPLLIDGNSYTISVGAQYSNQSQVWVAVDTIVASGISAQKTTPTAYTSSVAPSFSLQGPSSLAVGCTSYWTLQMNIRDLYNNVTITAFGLNASSSLVIDRISLETYGIFYSYYAGIEDSYNFTQMSMDSAGTITGGVLDMGQIVNSGFNIYGGSAGTGNYTITAHIAARAVNSSAISSSVNFLGISVSMSDNLVYSTATSFSITPTVLSNVSVAATFALKAITVQAAKGAIAGFLLNMTLPPSTTQEYTLEVAAPYSGSAQMNLTRIRVISVGYNYPSFQQPTVSYSSNDSINNDYAIVGFGLISNTGQRSTAYASTISIEISGQVLDSSAVTVNQSLTLIVGVRLGNSSFWVGQTSITVIATPTTLAQAPTLTLTNIMNDPIIYPLSSVAYYLDIYIPPATTVYTLSVNVSSYVYGNVAMTKIYSMDVYQLGSGIVFSQGNQLPSAAYYNGTGEYTLDGFPVNTSAQMTFTPATNVLAQDWPWMALQLSTIRVRIVVQARSNITTLPGATTLMTNVTVQYSSTQSSQIQDLFTYNSTKLQPYTNMLPGQPKPYVTVGNWQNNATLPYLNLGTALAFEFNVATPFLTITDLTISANIPSLSSLSICSLKVQSFGRDMGAPAEGARTAYTKPTNQTTAASLAIQGVTNIEPYSPFTDDYTSMTVSYQLVVMLQDNPLPATGNMTYTYSITTNSAMSWSGTVTMFGSATVPTSSVDPVVYLRKANNVSYVTYGGAALYVLQVYVPPGTTTRYRLELYGPWTTADAGKLGLWDARVMSIGSNLPCSNGAYIATFGTRYNSSFDPSLGVNDTIILDLGYLSNIANSTNTDIVDPLNLVTVEIAAYIPAISRTAVNDTLSLSAALYYNTTNAWAGFSNVTVVANPIAVESSGDISLSLTQQNNTYSQPVGVLRTWCVNVTLPQTMTPLKLIFDMGSTYNEAVMTVHYIRAVYYGVNIVHNSPNATYLNVSAPGGQPNQAVFDFGYVFNTYSSYRDSYRTGEALDNVITVWFDVMVADNLANTDQSVKSFTVTASYLTNGTAKNATKSGNVTVISPTTDNTTYSWNAWTDNITSQVLPNDTISLYLFINHTAASRRVPRNLVAHYRIPYFSQLINVTNVTGKLPDRVNSSAKGVEFQWNALYFSEYSSIAFTMKLDPSGVLLPGLLTQAVTIPVDLTHNRVNKNDQTGNTVDYFYTPILPVQFTAYIPECYTALGMQSGTILDCQISASSAYSTNTAAQSRLNVGQGWVSSPRGPPFYQSEYVQVDLGVQTKFTAIAVQPQRGFASERVSTFFIQYSRLGLRWFDATDAFGSKRVFVANFTATPSENETVLIQFGGQPFVGQFIRIIPQNNTNPLHQYYQRLRFEIYGCLATGAVAKTYTCPSTVSTQKTVVPRQMLMNPNDGRLFVCMLEAVGGSVVCSYTNDFGTSWFSIDDNVCNVNYYSNTTGSLYGVARSQDMYVRSDDLGDTWFAIEDSEYTNATVGFGVTAAISLPFNNWETMTPAQLNALYNFSYSGSLWTVDVSGVLWNGVRVAWWGQSLWQP